MAYKPTCGTCGQSPCMGGCNGGGTQKASKGRKKKFDVLDNLSKESADGWVKKMGTEVSGPSTSGKPKKRHYETIPDPVNKGKFKIVFVED